MQNNTQRQNEYHVWFRVHNFECSPDEITKIVGVNPTEIYIKGEFRTIDKKKQHKMLNKENAWILESNLPSSVSIEKHLEHLLEEIKPHKQKFLDIIKEYSAEFGSAVYYYEVNPEITLNKAIIKNIAGLNVDIFFDIYCLGEDE